MGGIFEVAAPLPADYIPTGDKALLVAWAVLSTTVGETAVEEVSGVLILEDGHSVVAPLADVRFDYRYNNDDQSWVDVSKIPTTEDDHADTDQEHADHGSESVPGLVPDADGASEGDPGD